MELYIIVIAVVSLFTLGFLEKKKNNQNINNIDIRINVNGIRGKSTITRMITSVLSEAGYNTVGKTTGTAPRIINNQEHKEIEITRKPKGVNIIEQVNIIDYSASKKVDALVCECMAVNPEYQKVYQENMIQANIGVIINVLEDHMDVMGPTLDEVALGFTTTIPYDGILIIQDNQYVDYFSKIAQERNTKVFIANEMNVPKGLIEQFKFIVFPNNIAITLALSDALNIDRKTAYRGMLKMNPDPGALSFIEYSNGKQEEFLFVNGFAINDPSSGLEAWEVLKEKKIINSEVPVLLFNARPDRVDRTKQFADDFIDKIDQDIELVVIGEEINYFEEKLKNNSFSNVAKYYLFESESIHDIFSELTNIFRNKTVFSVGNIHGHGYDLLNKLENKEEFNADN